MSPVSHYLPSTPMFRICHLCPQGPNMTLRPPISLESHHVPRFPPHPRSPEASRPQFPGHALTSALPLGVSPVMLLALGADTAPKAGLALALPRHLQREQHAQPVAHHVPGG